MLIIFAKRVKVLAWKVGTAMLISEVRYKVWNGKTMTEPISIRSDRFKWLKSSDILLRPTGLKDKNGKEIYEGGLFDAWEGRSKYSIQWLDDHACFKLVWVAGDVGDSKVRHYFDIYMAMYQFEPIGNIYEHPGLLK